VKSICLCDYTNAGINSILCLRK